MIPDNENLIMTVKYCIHNIDLGFCHSHEHLFIEEGQSSKMVPSLKLDDFDKTVKELSLYKDNGGTSIVDAQPVGCGRMADYLYRASVVTNVNIIASTGFHKLVFYPQNHWVHAMNDQQLTDIFISEIGDGMFIGCDTEYPSVRIPAKAGVIKTASDVKGITDEYIKLFSSAAEASNNTGVPIMSHTEMGKAALEQIEFYNNKGVNAASIILCHIDRNLKDYAYLLEIAQTGVYLELDTIGRFKYHSDEDEAGFILKLVEHGHENQILLGLDTTSERMKNYGADLGLDYIKNVFIPLLKSYGLKEQTIDKFTIHNPAKAFTIKNKK